MMESLFIPGAPMWSAAPAWPGSWLPPSPMPSPPGGPVATAAPPASAPLLLAAAAMHGGRTQVPSTDHDVEDLMYDALDLVPGSSDVEVRCEAGRVTLSGSVSHKRLKHGIGEIAWAISAVSDVANNIAITSRRRARSFSRENEPQPVAAGRKQA